MMHHDNATDHMALLVCEFLVKHEMTVVPQPTYSPDMAPADIFSFVLKVEIHSERSPVSDNRRDRRKFTMGPTHYPAKCIPKLEKKLEAVNRHWWSVL
jgi:hypothetical protein